MTCHLGSQTNYFAGLQHNRGSAPLRVEKYAAGVLGGGGFAPQTPAVGNFRGNFQLEDNPQQGIVGVDGVQLDEVGIDQVEGDGILGEVLPEEAHCRVGGVRLAEGIWGFED